MAQYVKIWLDDLREPPESGYCVCHSVNQAKTVIKYVEKLGDKIVELNLDHDLGDFYKDGGDGIELVKWLAETERHYPVIVHSMNPVGRANMEAIVKRYWK